MRAFTLPRSLPLLTELKLTLEGGESRALSLAGLSLFFALWLAGWRLSHVLPPQEWLDAWLQPLSMLSPQQLIWRFALLPQLTICLLVGWALGLAGCLLQQGLRNPLAAPETLGVQNGSLLALALTVLYQPEWLTEGQEWIAFAGGLAAALLVMAMAARQHHSPLALLLAGMLVSLLTGSGLTLLLLNHDLALVSLLSLSAGSLAQDGWQTVEQLWPRLLGVSLLLLLLLRPLRLLELDDQSARGVGASPTLLRLFTLLLAIYLSATITSQVGVISFIALAAPLLARLAGARRLLPRLLCSLLFGASLLLVTDHLVALWPHLDLATGSVVALLCAPLLLWLLLRTPLAQAPRTMSSLGARQKHPRRLLLLLALLCALALLLGIGLAREATGWHWFAQGDVELLTQWRLPRVVAAMAAGAMLAIAGVVIQRLSDNPLASPEVLGISSGCGLGLMALGIIAPEATRPWQLLVGSSSALLLLALLLWWSRRTHFAPLRLLLCGMTITALFTACQTLLLGSGDPRGVQLLSWMSGSTYYVTGDLAWSLLLIAGLGLALSWPLARWLDLLPLGETLCRSWGMELSCSRLSLLLLASLLTAAATLLVGPISFVGLLAPHLARTLGLCRTREQLLGAIGCGVLVMLLADWTGRQWLFPDQIPAGVMASLLGGSYFLLCLWQRR